MIQRKLIVAVAAILVAAGPVYAAVQTPAAKAKAPAPAAKGAQQKAAPAAPAAAPAQTEAEKEAQIRSVMDTAVEVQIAKAGQLAQSVVQQTIRGRLANAGRQRLTLDADPGAYVLAGYCDDACSNLDFRMLGAQDAVLGSDENPDKTPQTQATVTAKGSFVLEMVMTACAKEACAWALQISKKTAP